MSRPARQTASLPDPVDIGNQDHAALLSKLGIDPGNVGDALGGLRSSRDAADPTWAYASSRKPLAASPSRQSGRHGR
jgi:hypothetical protein